jgi:Bacterial Ig-like domain (group 1)
MKSFFKSRLVLTLVTLILLAATIAASLAGIAHVTTARAAGSVDVFVGYADSLRASPTNFPTPWAGSPGVTFEGCQPPSACTYDAGAVRVVNNTSATVTVNSVTVHIDTCALSGWPSASLAPGGQLIVTQVASGASSGCTPSGPTGPPLMDTSDIGPGGSPYAGNCTPDGIRPTVDVTLDGTTTTYTDSGQILNTGGLDLASCPSGTNESTQWTTVGSAPCPGAVLSLAPPSQTHSVGQSATVTATLTNTCGQPLSGALVNFQVISGPNKGLTGAGTTDSNGQASFTYSSTQPGTDTLQASVTNPAGTITSNTVTVTWTLTFASGGSFVIGDLENHSGASVLWWGAQWSKSNPMSGGAAPASFKGFEDTNSTPACGQTWTTDTGNSTPPPPTVPLLMGVIVASHITQSGSTISGDIVHIVVVRTDPGYQPDPGHPGTGTVIAQVC